MIKIITSEDADMWDKKVNFVDTNNVLVGYDTYQSCCEDAGWYITNMVSPYDTRAVVENYDLGGYVFDPGFCVKGSEVFGDLNTGGLDEGDQVFFAMVHPEKETLFLCLFNSHNGYYSHGFTMTVGGDAVAGGSL